MKFSFHATFLLMKFGNNFLEYVNINILFLVLQKITAHPDYPVKYSGNITILVPLDLRRTLTVYTGRKIEVKNQYYCRLFSFSFEKTWNLCQNYSLGDRAYIYCKTDYFVLHKPNEYNKAGVKVLGRKL